MWEEEGRLRLAMRLGAISVLLISTLHYFKHQPTQLAALSENRARIMLKQLFESHQTHFMQGKKSRGPPGPDF